MDKFVDGMEHYANFSYFYFLVISKYVVLVGIETRDWHYELNENASSLDANENPFNFITWNFFSVKKKTAHRVKWNENQFNRNWSVGLLFFLPVKNIKKCVSLKREKGFSCSIVWNVLYNVHWCRRFPQKK